MKRYFDKVNKRLVYMGQTSDEAFWDQHWSDKTADFAGLVKQDSRFVVKHTKKVLRPGARILEGGCGLGRNVYALCHHGYDACGIDYAAETVEKVRRHVPELDIQCGDVRGLPYQDEFFDGYWSLGVIEHLYDSFAPIVREARRVLKNDGYLFLTFPYMSGIRRLKAYLKYYPDWDAAQQNLEEFYQFALDRLAVVREVEGCGFCLWTAQPFDGVKGFKDEITLGRGRLQSIYDGESTFVRVIRKLLDITLCRLAGHSLLLIFRKGKRH